MATINWRANSFRASAPTITTNPAAPQPANETSAAAIGVAGVPGDRRITFSNNGSISAVAPNVGVLADGYCRIVFQEAFTVTPDNQNEKPPGAFVSFLGAGKATATRSVARTLARTNIWLNGIRFPWLKVVSSRVTAAASFSGEARLYSVAAGKATEIARSTVATASKVVPTDAVGANLLVKRTTSPTVPIAFNQLYVLVGYMDSSSGASGIAFPGTVAGTFGSGALDGTTNPMYGGFAKVGLVENGCLPDGEMEEESGH